MKVRNGFVSNSSSSSFLIYGICEDSATKLRKILKKKFPEKYKEVDDDDIYLSEELYDLCGDTGIEVHSPYGDGYFIGKSWSAVGDNETGKQFKELIEKTLKEIFGDDLEFDTFEAAWHD